MLAVDTNVVVRFLANDDEAQHQRAVRLFSEHGVYLSKTVILETEWVLRSVYKFEPDEIAAALRGLIRLQRVQCEDFPAVDASVEAFAAGMDFADALHFSSGSNHDEGFASFDTRFIKRARKYWPEAKIVEV
jgi:predicted nucleic-acid-binding protein